jgi:hypothetical protein
MLVCPLPCPLTHVLTLMHATAVATDRGRVYVWGGAAWEGGIAAGRDASFPTEVSYSGVPPCYQCASVSLAHRHGFLVFRKHQ